MCHRQVGAPPGLVEPEEILPEARLVEKARIARVYGRARLAALLHLGERPFLHDRIAKARLLAPVVAPVRSAKIVYSSPDKLAHAGAHLVHPVPLGVRWTRPSAVDAAPSGCLPAVGRVVEVLSAHVAPLLHHGEVVLAAS